MVITRLSPCLCAFVRGSSPRASVPFVYCLGNSIYFFGTADGADNTDLRGKSVIIICVVPKVRILLNPRPTAGGHLRLNSGKCCCPGEASLPSLKRCQSRYFLFFFQKTNAKCTFPPYIVWQTLLSVGESYKRLSKTREERYIRDRR